ncbi:peptide-binding protein [Nocardiopsis rhodophaea]|uniref:Peptide-binding protein n=1 Tax=Nocardiopsis rhodophaea TaxID=280238 RepID=A0ABN2SFN7_9ACTN
MPSREVRIGRTADVTVLNPLLYSDLATGEVLNRIFDHLVITDDDMRYVPGRLVRDWATDDSGLVWDFRMRPEARWHDGWPVTADDAVFTFGALLDPAVGSRRRPEFLVAGEPIRFTAPEPHLLRVHLPGPYPALLDSLAWRPILPQHRYRDAPLAAHPLNAAPVGSGAFAFEERGDGGRVVLRANRDYHLGRPPLDRVVWRCLPDPEDAAAAIRAGELDYLQGVDPAAAEELACRPELRTRSSVDASFTYLAFHLDHPLFSDAAVRRALARGIDREGLVRDVLNGRGEVAHSMVTPLSPWHNPLVPRTRYDPVEAEQMLDAAGFPRGPGGLRAAPDGRELAFTLLTVAGDRVKERAAAGVAADLARLGVAVAVETHPMEVLLREHVYPRRYAAALMALAPGPDPAYLHACYHSRMLTPQGWNRTAYRSPVVDSLLDRAETEPDPDARRALLDEAQARIVGDVPQVFLFHPVVVDVAHSRLRLPRPPRTPGNRFMHLHQWDVRAP